MRSLVRMGALSVAVASLAACTSPDRPDPGSGAAQPARSGTPPAALSGDARASVVKALAAYESIRARLAQDSLEGIGDAAAEIETQSRLAMQAGPEPLRPHLEAVASSASDLKSVAGAEIARVRSAFGEMSRRFVVLLGSEPSLAEGRYVFECPMAETYKKWLQVDERISNPYMGSRMPECGAPSTL